MVGCGDEMPGEMSARLVQKFDNFLCKDSAFTECVGLNQKSCEKHMPVVLNGCDYSRVWKEIRRADHDPTSEDNLYAESRKYGECVNIRFKRQFFVDTTVFEQCLKRRYERYVEPVSPDVRSSRP